MIFRTTSDGSVQPATIEFDFNGGGVVDYTANSVDAANVSTSLTGTSLALPSIRFKDADGTVLYTIVKQIYQRDPFKVYVLIKGVYNDLLSRLGAGNINGAENLLAVQARPVYDSIFSSLGSGLPSIVPQLGTVDSISASMTSGEIAVIRDGGSGKQVFFIHVFRGQDGIWRIESM